ncbi:OmpA family protein [Aridibaculum aurantiacum]|uniref:OmpA family protein n=1 Tax=Aridibaculum aurantiacum TaxID=2810307 RepID=UPI001A9601FE|nr:OmpA family protein [Aridibaculum aurantiacum]
MKKLMLAIAVFTMPFTMQAQFGNLLEKAKSKINSRANNKIDQGMEGALDKVEAGVKKPGSATSSKPAEAKDGDGEEKEVEESGQPAKMSVNSKFDFVPGERIIYSEDFAQDVIGELPLTWNASGKGEVQTINGKQGKWLRVFQNNTYLSGNKKDFGENFTVEFDAIYFFQPKLSGYVMPDISFGLFSTGEEDNLENKFLQDQNSLNSAIINLHPSGAGGAYMSSYKTRARTFGSDRSVLNEYSKYHNKVMHYAIQIQKTRFRMWINQDKVFDVPRGVNTNALLNQIYFHMESSNYKDEEVGFYVSNIKVATGLPDTRHKLVEEGKFSTTGILFDFQSATIRPESYGVIKEIGSVLKENPAIKINIIGHTSNDGDANANLALSKLRSAAVKDVLVKEYAIDAARLTTDGKGGSQPVGDNKTTEGKAQNRRVEFIKL